MYFNKTWFTVLTIFGCCVVDGLELRPTLKPSLVVSRITTKPVLADKDSHEPPVTILEQYDRRNADGSYEFRYHLSDGTVRYEQGDIAYINHIDVIIVRGYYSYRLPNNSYLTVYYRADQNGYSQESSVISDVQPNLPRTLGTKKDAVPTKVPKSTTTEKTLRVTTPITLTVPTVTTTKNDIKSTSLIPLILSTQAPKPIKPKH